MPKSRFPLVSIMALTGTNEPTILQVDVVFPRAEVRVTGHARLDFNGRDGCVPRTELAAVT